jgi:hypothetical protein
MKNSVGFVVSGDINSKKGVFVQHSTLLLCSLQWHVANVFSIKTMVTRTRHNVTLYVHCLSSIHDGINSVDLRILLIMLIQFLTNENYIV